MRKYCIIISFICITSFLYSQEVSFDVIGGRADVNKWIEINSNINIISSSFETELYYYPSAHYNLTRIKNIDYGIGFGMLNNESSQNSLYGGFRTIYFWSKKFQIGNGIEYNYIFEDGYSNVGLLLRKDFNPFRKSRFQMHVSTGVNYCTENKGFTYELGIGIGFDRFVYYKKPVLYFYPVDTTELKLIMHFSGDLSFSWPEYKNGWNITVYPNSDILNHTDSTKYKYLFWEGTYKLPELSSVKDGFYIVKNELPGFLLEKLALIGFNYGEINDFITYWIPILKREKYFVHFMTGSECNQVASYDFSKKPDSFVRTIVLFIDAEKINAGKQEQVLKPATRKGFVVTEWGGAEY